VIEGTFRNPARTEVVRGLLDDASDCWARHQHGGSCRKADHDVTDERRSRNEARDSRAGGAQEREIPNHDVRDHERVSRERRPAPSPERTAKEGDLRRTPSTRRRLTRYRGDDRARSDPRDQRPTQLEIQWERETAERERRHGPPC